MLIGRPGDPGDTGDTARVVDALWRMESAKIIGALARMLRNVGLAEELAQDAMVEALGRWPQSGIPDNPGAWLMTVARRPLICTSARLYMSARLLWSTR